MLETHKVKWTDPAPQAVLLPPQVPLVTQMPPSPKHTLQTINKNEIKRTQKYSNITLNNRKLRGWNWLELQIAKTSHWLKQNKKPSGSAEIPRLDSTNAGVCSTVEGEGRKKWLSYTFWSAQKSWERVIAGSQRARIKYHQSDEKEGDEWVALARSLL